MALNHASQANSSRKALTGLLRDSCLTLTCVLSLVAVSGCDKRQSDPDEDEVVAGETYDEYDQRRDGLNGSQGTFEGKGCTQDCSGHEAGYAWAEDKGITDPDDCGGKSWSFIEGCRAFAEQASGEED